MRGPLATEMTCVSAAPWTNKQTNKAIPPTEFCVIFFSRKFQKDLEMANLAMRVLLTGTAWADLFELFELFVALVETYIYAVRLWLLLPRRIFIF